MHAHAHAHTLHRLKWPGGLADRLLFNLLLHCAICNTAGSNVSSEGVQRDLLPILEGSTVSTRLGPLATDHVLFIASGAFHSAKPGDMLAVLQVGGYSSTASPAASMTDRGS